MHPIIEAGIMKTRTRPRRTAGRTRLVWRGAPDRAAGRCGCCACRGCSWSSALAGRAPAGDLRFVWHEGPGGSPAGPAGSARRDRPWDWQFMIVRCGRGDWGSP
jgi:hypothetical protein